MASRIKVAFWNVNMGASSTQKHEVFCRWVRSVKPELLVLEEAPFSFPISVKEALEAAGLSNRPIASVGMIEKNYSKNSSTKWITAFKSASDDLDISSFDSGIRAFNQSRRMILIRVRDKRLKSDDSMLEVLGVHANANESSSGILHTIYDRFADGDKRKVAVVAGGDFNMPFTTPKLRDNRQWKSVKPRNYNNDHLPFTQWSRGANSRGENQQALSALGLNDKKLKVYNGYIKPSPNGVIDFALGNEQVDIDSLSMTDGDYALTFDILTSFDHFPVVYELRWLTDG